MLASKLTSFSDNLFHTRGLKRLLTIFSSRNASAYDPDGQTTVSVLNQQHGAPLMVDSYSELGFRLNNGLFVIGPMILFPKSVISWNVEQDKDINEDSLSIFTNLSPKLDILVVGTSDNKIPIYVLNNQFHNILRKMKIHVEVLYVEKACTTFNFLNAEQRFVAAALIPPLQIKITEDDRFHTQFRRKIGKKEDIFLEE